MTPNLVKLLDKLDKIATTAQMSKADLRTLLAVIRLHELMFKSLKVHLADNKNVTDYIESMQKEIEKLLEKYDHARN